METAHLPLPHFEKTGGSSLLSQRASCNQNMTSVPDSQVLPSHRSLTPLDTQPFETPLDERCDIKGDTLSLLLVPSTHRPHPHWQLVLSGRPRPPGPFWVGLNCHPVINPSHKALETGAHAVPRSLSLTICNPFRGNWQEMAARKTPAPRNWWDHLSSSSRPATGSRPFSGHRTSVGVLEAAGWLSGGSTGPRQMLTKFGKERMLP